MTNSPTEYFRLIDLSTVPVPKFVEVVDYETIKRNAIEFLISIDPDYSALLESDPAFKIIEAFAYRELLLRQRINDAALQNTITEATGTSLDVLAALLNVKRLDGEEDESLRRRALLSIYISAVAGPRKAYEFHALSAHVNVIDASVYSPSAGEIAVTVLAYEDIATAELTEEQLSIGRALFAQPRDKTISRVLCGPSSSVLKAVRSALTGEAVRPLTDSVTVQPPNVLPFDIVARLVIYPGPDAETVRQASIVSLSAYLQSIRRVSYDATLAGIIAALKVGGVQNVIIDSPVADVVAGHFDLPVCLMAKVTVERVDV